MEIFGIIFCGLGLFFIGFRMISNNLRNLAGSRFRKLVQRATGTGLRSAVTGFFSGVISQSAVASVFITTGFHTAGLISFGQALVIINWANIGTSVLLFVVALNIKLMIFFFTGIIGLAYFLKLDKTNRVQLLFQLILGLCLLFLGVVFIRNGAQQMQSLTWFGDALKLSSGSVVLLFITGIFLTVVAQSGPTVSVVALTLCSVGLLNLFQAEAVVLGTGIGSAINIIGLSASLKGSGRQLCIYQGLFKTAGVVAAFILILSDHLWSQGNNPGFLSLMAVNPARQVAWLFLIMQVLPAILFTLIQNPVKTFLERISPPSAGETAGQPAFITESALNDPATALLLAEKEQLRLIRMLPEYLVPVSPDREIIPVVGHHLLHDSFILVDIQLMNYLKKLLNKPDAGIQLQVLQAQHFSILLHDLEANLEDFLLTINTSVKSIEDRPLSVNLIESMHVILDTTFDTFNNPDTPGMEMMMALTNEKGEMLQKTREAFFQKNSSIDIDVRQSIFTLTILFERMCWILRSMTTIRMNAIKGL